MTTPGQEPAPPLELDDFPEYFSELWHTDGGPRLEPFPWQIELLERVHSARRWPEVIDLPTGSGKTSVVDLAVFLLALGADEPPGRQWHPRRIVMVVDRRVIVDQAADRAAQIADRLKGAESGVLNRVAGRLSSLAMGPDGTAAGVPLQHAVLRGGIVRDESWAHRPDVPAVISSTVDQVGSRLLHRGYGVSRGMRPVHAGLLGEDVLYLLDEVHLARPYAETLSAVGQYRRLGGHPSELPDRWQTVQLSATVHNTSGWVFPGRPLDPGSHPVLSRRLTARKPAALVEVTVPADPARARQRLAVECAQRATRLIGSGARTIAVIVNRVDTARRVHAELRTAAGEVDVELITGRMRPADRDAVLAVIGPRVANGRPRSDGDKPLIVVATQSIEAGADFDLDAIVTECASLDALRQRFGRVDRDGALSAAGTTYESSIVVGSREIAEGAMDPVYGEALRNTWRWLKKLPDVDFGIRQLELPVSKDDLGALLPPQQHAPILLPTHLDRWVRTSTYGVEADPEVAQWLHGIDASNEAADVTVVWRDDIDEALLADASDRRTRAALEARLNACPPRPEEMLSVPIASVRAWLSGSPDELPLADAWTKPLETQLSTGRRRNVLRWRDERAEYLAGDDRAERARADGDLDLDRSPALAPGDTIVVPASWGGIVAGTWNPSSAAAVPDVAQQAYRGKGLVLRLSRALDARLRAVAGTSVSTDSGVESAALTELVDGVAVGEFPDPEVLGELSPRERIGAVAVYLDVMEHYAEGSTRDVIDELREIPSSWTMQSFAERATEDRTLYSYIISVKRTGLARDSRSPYSGLAEEDGRDGPSFVDAGTRTITLGDHLEGVRRWAECLASNLGFSPELVHSLGRAGQLHDIGKLDPRFQLWLHGGDDVSRDSADAALAKSVTVTDQRSRREARRRSGYPAGQRHELLSLSLAPVEPGGRYADLIRHLVATHHGNGRYRFDAQSELPSAAVSFGVGSQLINGSTTHELERLDSGIADRFWALIREWGWFRLAWLEAILRLADHQDSREPLMGGQLAPATGEISG